MGKICVYIFNISYSNIHHQSIIIFIVKLWNAWSAVQAWTLIQNSSIFRPIIHTKTSEVNIIHVLIDQLSITKTWSAVDIWTFDSRFMCLSTNCSMTSEVESCCSCIHQPIIHSRTSKADIQLHTWKDVTAGHESIGPK